jgi:aminoglycoside 2'-N-acetyltransferase I
MAELSIVHTVDLDPVTLDAVRVLLHDVFVDAPLTAEDWEHCLGGLHVILRDGGELIGHAAVVQRRLLHEGCALRTGYVEGVGVRVDRRRRGHGGALMAEAERIIRAGYTLGALAAADQAVAFYADRGWRRWQGPTSVLTPTGIQRTPEDDDCIFVLPSGPLDLTAALTCDWRDGDVW